MEDRKECEKTLRVLYRERSVMWFGEKPDKLPLWKKKVLLKDIYNWKAPLYAKTEEESEEFFQIFRNVFKKDIKACAVIPDDDRN